MASNVPFVRQELDKLSLIPRLVTYGILCLLFYQNDIEYFWLIALFVYMMLRQLARLLFIPNSIFEGVKRIKEEKFQEAIPFFQETINYYTKNKWIDQYRFFLLISYSKSSFKESSVCNMAFCYLHSGEVKKAKEIYENLLLEYPDNINAKSSLHTINLISANSSNL